MMYSAYQAHSDMMWPLRATAKASLPVLKDRGMSALDAVRKLAAAYEVFNLAELTHKRPPFGIASVRVGDDELAVVEEVPFSTPFASLLHFTKPGLAGRNLPPQPKVLIAAPMSGHFATLLRDTVRTMLPDHDVYITDWHNARDVPLSAGRFGLDEYTDHLIDFLAAIGEGAHLLAVCQPTVAALSAVTIMSEDVHPATPLSLTLMAGPIDCRISPTSVNTGATSKPIEWFEQNLISTVPWRHGGGGRRVYPGFVQVSAFMSMNKERHVNAFKEMYANLLAGETEKVQFTRSFYEEYFAVADLAAEFYLETVQWVFQDYALPLGKLKYRGRKVDPGAIRRTALLTVEGERDDICSVGQTLAAQDLCSRLRPYMRTHYVQPGVGHFGVFSGKRWSNHIYPLVRDVIHVSQ